MAWSSRSRTGASFSAPLLIAADGRNSPTREAAGIRVARWKYDHQAIVSVLRHERPHDHVAYEIFYPTGPFALLPMTDDAGGHRSAIVWSVPKEDAAGWLSLNDEDFAAEARRRWAASSARSRCSRRARPIPLGFHHAAQITAKRLALVGDAAHAIHPIAGQGLNLGFRDVAALAQVLVEGARLGLDLGDQQLLDRYQRWRSLDALVGRVRHRQPDADLRRSRQDRVGGPPLRHGPGRPHLAAPQPADERSARHQRRAAAAAPRACRSNYWSVGSISTPPVTATRWNCISWTSRSARPSSVGFLEQRLLGADVERRDLGDGIDQHLVVEPADRVPVDREPERIAEPARLALDLGALRRATAAAARSSSNASMSTSAQR